MALLHSHSRRKPTRPRSEPIGVPDPEPHRLILASTIHHVLITPYGDTHSRHPSAPIFSMSKSKEMLGQTERHASHYSATGHLYQYFCSSPICMKSGVSEPHLPRLHSPTTNEAQNPFNCPPSTKKCQSIQLKQWQDCQKRYCQKRCRLAHLKAKEEVIILAEKDRNITWSS